MVTTEKNGQIKKKKNGFLRFAPFSDWFVLWQRLAVNGCGRGRTDGRAAGGRAHVLPAGLGAGAGLRLRCDATGTKHHLAWQLSSPQKMLKLKAKS